jgi:threonine dehydrogenase-like Zn-dependent dehydrogenase
MKAVAVFPQTRELRLIEQEEPHLTRDTQVKLRLLEVGVCGTDKEICTFAYGTPPEASEYLILGHEALGEVVEVGSAVTDFVVGDLVVPLVRRPCPQSTCRACRSGHPDFCETGDFTERGINGRHGFMAEYVVDDARYMTLVPRQSPTLRDVAVLVEPATIAAKAAAQVVTIQQRLPWFVPPAQRKGAAPQATALVLGAGAVGLLGTVALCDASITTFVYDRAPAPNVKSQLVEAIGATYLWEGSSAEPFADRVGHVDIVYEAAGHSALAFQAMKALGPNSIFIFTGVPALGAPREVDTDTLMRNIVLKNQVILGTVNAGKADFLNAIRALDRITQRWPAAVRALITERHPLEDFRDVLLGQVGGIKNVLTIAQGRQQRPVGAGAARGETPPR